MSDALASHGTVFSFMFNLPPTFLPPQSMDRVNYTSMKLAGIFNPPPPSIMMGDWGDLNWVEFEFYGAYLRQGGFRHVHDPPQHHAGYQVPGIDSGDQAHVGRIPPPLRKHVPAQRSRPRHCRMNSVRAGSKPPPPPPPSHPWHCINV